MTIGTNVERATPIFPRPQSKLSLWVPTVALLIWAAIAAATIGSFGGPLSEDRATVSVTEA